MAWETKKNGKRYYYHPVRVNGRVEKRYFGSGPQAELAAELIEAGKKHRRVDRDKFNSAKKDLQLLEQQMNQLDRAPLDAIKSDRTNQPANDRPTDPVVSTPPEVLNRAKELFQAREAGDPNAEAQLTELIDQFPSLMHRLGDVAGLARLKLVKLVAGKDAVFEKAIVKKLEDLRSQFPANEDPVGKLLIERILASWLQVSFTEGKIAEVERTDLKSLELYTRLQQKAERRHMNAIRAWEHYALSHSKRDVKKG